MKTGMKWEMIGELVEQAAEKMKCAPHQIDVYVWPQVFGSTAGPRYGIGGQAITTFTVVAFESATGDRLKWCAGIWRPWGGEMGERWK